MNLRDKHLSVPGTKQDWIKVNNSPGSPSIGRISPPVDHSNGGSLENWVSNRQQKRLEIKSRGFCNKKNEGR